MSWASNSPGLDHKLHEMATHLTDHPNAEVSESLHDAVSDFYDDNSLTSTAGGSSTSTSPSESTGTAPGSSTAPTTAPPRDPAE